MKFFFPDSQDMVDPSFDFETETRSEWRIRQRDDVYSHEVFDTPPYDGILISKAIVDGAGEKPGKYSFAQRHRLRRVGVKEFFRIGDRPLATMGDCGAFTYVNEERPPFSADEVINFYEDCRFDYGLSIDHVILGYKADLDNELPGLNMVPEEWRIRQEMTFELADEFLCLATNRHVRFAPIGVAQGWSPKSYATAVEKLQEIGYRHIALGGMVPLRTPDILHCLETIGQIRCSETRLHLLGVTRCERINSFRKLGVTSFDSTSPLRQAFMDDKDNYYTPNRTYVAIRVPQSEGNPAMMARIRSGELDQDEIRGLETECLKVLRDYNAYRVSIDEVLERVLAYERTHHPQGNRGASYRDVLEDRPWEACHCSICREIGIHVVIFRGAERNKRRGFHNLFVFNNRLHAVLASQN